MSNLLKSVYIVKKDETRVIDSNKLIASRLQRLAEVIDEQPATEEDFVEGFTAGLNAEQLELLLEDNPDSGEYVDAEYDQDNQEYESDPEMYEQMQEQATRIIEDAQAEAENIIAAANSEKASIESAAHEEGYAKGMDEGYSEGLKRVDEKMAELDAMKDELQEDYEKRIADIEPLLVDAITDIYEHIFHVSLSSNREIMLNLLHDTVRNIEGGKNFIIHVSKNDYEYINNRKEQLTEGLGSTDTIEVIEDLTLFQSECFIEASGGIYDCGIGTEMELLKKELMLLAYQKK